MHHNAFSFGLRIVPRTIHFILTSLKFKNFKPSYDTGGCPEIIGRLIIVNVDGLVESPPIPHSGRVGLWRGRLFASASISGQNRGMELFGRGRLR
jgi:hypothetical protein